MIIEQGDLFVVTRGYKRLKNTGYSVFFWSAMDHRDPDQPDEYDRSYSDVVFRAVAVVESMCVAEFVYSRWKHEGEPGRRIQLNLDQIEVMTVPQQYVDALTENQEPSP